MRRSFRRWRALENDSGAAGVGVDDQIQFAGQVVDHGQFFGHHQRDIGQAQVIFRRAAGQFFLDMAHRVVAEVAGQAAAKTRHAGAQRDLETRLVLFDEVERIAFVFLDHRAIFHDLGAVAKRAQHRGGGQADEGKRPKRSPPTTDSSRKVFLPPCWVCASFRYKRERGFQVGESFGDQGDAVIALLGQRFEFEFGHVSLHAASITCASCARHACPRWVIKKPAACVEAHGSNHVTAWPSGLPGLPASPEPGLNRAGFGDIVFFDEKRVHDKVWCKWYARKLCESVLHAYEKRRFE